MSREYKYGEKVVIRHGDVDGIVTAVIHRGEYRAYEVSYAGPDGPKSVNCESVELDSVGGKKIGF